jgi:hypothetical protein
VRASASLAAAAALVVSVQGIAVNGERARVWNEAGRLGDEVTERLSGVLPPGPARIALLGYPDNVDGAWVLKHGLLERVRMRRPDLDVWTPPSVRAAIDDPAIVRERRAFLWLGEEIGWIDVSAGRRGPCLEVLKPGVAPEGFLGSESHPLALHAGPYTVAVFAHGEGALGEDARMAVSLDGVRAGERAVPARSDVYTFAVQAKEGENVLSLSLTNDFYDPKRHLDRNLWVEAVVVIGRCP